MLRPISLSTLYKHFAYAVPVSSLLTAKALDLYGDAAIRDDKVDENLTYTIANITKAPRITEVTTPATRPREVIFLDILPPLYKYSLDSATTFEAWIIFFDL